MWQCSSGTVALAVQWHSVRACLICLHTPVTVPVLRVHRMAPFSCRSLSPGAKASVVAAAGCSNSPFGVCMCGTVKCTKFDPHGSGTIVLMTRDSDVVMVPWGCPCLARVPSRATTSTPWTLRFESTTLGTNRALSQPLCVVAFCLAFVKCRPLVLAPHAPLLTHTCQGMD